MNGSAIEPVSPSTAIKVNAVDQVLTELSDVFQELGCCTYAVGIKVHFEAKFKVYPFRRPPIHLRARIEAELERNVKRGVLKPVDSAICAFPTVNIVKPSGAIRICGDFKSSNQYLVMNQHPIPLPSDLFNSLGEKNDSQS
jgi:hypothetical protein